MRFDKLNAMIPAVVGGKEKVLSMSPYNAITLRMPGRHQNDTTPPGLDFVVCVDNENSGWIQHQFTHSDIFMDLEAKAEQFSYGSESLMKSYLRVVKSGECPTLMYEVMTSPVQGGIHAQTFLAAVQCLAVAEHRRYARFEAKFGGRYLPFRFGAGIVEGLWTAAQAIEKQKKGRPGVEWLERDHGTPSLTKELMG